MVVVVVAAVVAVSRGGGGGGGGGAAVVAVAKGGDEEVVVVVVVVPLSLLSRKGEERWWCRRHWLLSVMLSGVQEVSYLPPHPRPCHFPPHPAPLVVIVCVLLHCRGVKSGQLVGPSCVMNRHAAVFQTPLKKPVTRHHGYGFLVGKNIHTRTRTRDKTRIKPVGIHVPVICTIHVQTSTNRYFAGIRESHDNVNSLQHITIVLYLLCFSRDFAKSRN